MNSTGSAQTIRIGPRAVGGGERCFVIAEVAQSHDGSLGFAHAFIDAVADAGADAVKFQTHIAAAESTQEEPFRTRFTEQDATRFDYWRRMEFTPEQWKSLRRHADERGVAFLSSAFSIEAVQLLSALGMPAWKVGSGEFRSTDLIAAMLDTGAPILFSTGMATWPEIDAAVACFRGKGAAHALFQCTSRYPTSLDRVGLNVIDEMKTRYSCPVGLSDHSGKPQPALAAIARGADLLEVHVTFDRRMFGPDVKSSLTFGELSEVVAMRDACAVMFSSPVDKDAEAEALVEMRQIFSKSLAVKSDLEAGVVLSAEMLTTKKPGSGIPPDQLPKVVGRRLRGTVPHDRLLRWSDLTGEDDA